MQTTVEGTLRGGMRDSIWNAWLAMAIAMAALMLAPGAVHAQYTLTFDNPQTTGSNNALIAANYSYPGVTGTYVTITDGYASGFGSTTLLSNTCGNGNHQGICINTDQVFAGSGASGATAEFHNGQSTAGIGEFVFTPLGGLGINFTSVVLGNEGSDQAVEVRLYALDGVTLIATYTNSKLKKGDAKNPGAVTITQTDFSLNGGHTFDDLANGFRFEWGTSGGGNNGGDQLYIDNLIFKSELAPEPSSMLLLGTGLLVMVPMARRRKRRKD